MKVNTNSYVFVGDTVEIHTKNGDVILIDKDDFDCVRVHCWFDTKEEAIAKRKSLEAIYFTI